MPPDPPPGGDLYLLLLKRLDEASDRAKAADARTERIVAEALSAFGGAVESLALATEHLANAVEQARVNQEQSARIDNVEKWQEAKDNDAAAKQVNWPPIIAGAVIGSLTSGTFAVAAWLILTAAQSP